ncbi:MAG: cell division protein [Legionellales bacterium RIFCSPHIGHO2_12_FULL_35_11]|nr:MAG: cell division protein [Legionellales bacterium RIFCSPHIGHO2_12_FULL_35_11]
MNKNEYKHHVSRFFIVAIFFVLLFCILLWRLVDLTVLDRKFLQGQGNARSLRVIDIPAFRGMILDREGVALAISTPIKSVWVNPKVFAPNSEQLKKLSNILKIPEKSIRESVKKAERREFLYLKRQLLPEAAKKIASLKIPGLFFQEEFKRYYPESYSTAQLLGFTNLDDNGIEGLELAYQHWLVGINGKKRVVKDRTGRVIDEINTVKEPRAGNALQLSIDRRIQFYAYNELQKSIEEFGAKSGTVVVLDAKLGQVLAVVNAPSFNPNARGQYNKDSYRNRAFTDIFEPGSVIKPFSVASALDSGKYMPETIIDTRPGWMVLKGNTIRDIHNYGVLDVTGVLGHSSNVGVTKMTLSNPPGQLIDILEKAGFGKRTSSGYPGESDGGIIKISNASPFVLATLSFGYGLSVTAIQVARAYLIFANHGRLLPINLIYSNDPVEGEQVIKEKSADEVLAMLEETVNSGTGMQAKVAGYRVAGKTGTARIAGPGGYKSKHYSSSFVGIAPVSNPRVIVAVFINDPSKKNYYGAVVAGPLFAKVMAASLRTLDVPSG